MTNCKTTIRFKDEREKEVSSKIPNYTLIDGMGIESFKLEFVVRTKEDIKKLIMFFNSSTFDSFLNVANHQLPSKQPCTCTHHKECNQDCK